MAAKKRTSNKQTSRKRSPRAAPRAKDAHSAPRQKTPSSRATHALQRDDFEGDTAAYYAGIDPAFRDIAQRLRRIVRDAAPKAVECIKWGMPVFEHHGLLCYIQKGPGCVKLGFYEQGVYLSDPDGLLEGAGEAMRHIKIRSAKDIRAGLFAAWVKRAVELNEDR